MSNDYYNAGSWPATGASGASAPARAELTAITAGFAKLPTLTANGSKAVVVNAGATALETTTGTLDLAGNFATTGAYNTTLAQQASTTVTLPADDATMARTDAAQTFAGVQTITEQPILSSLTASQAVFSDGSKGLVSNAITGTGNVVMSASPTLTGTVAAEAITMSGSLTTTTNGATHHSTISSGSIGNTGTKLVIAPSTAAGLILILETVTDGWALFGFSVVPQTTVLISSSGTSWSITEDTGSSNNVYFSGGNLTIQNLMGSARTYKFNLLTVA